MDKSKTAIVFVFLKTKTKTKTKTKNRSENESSLNWKILSRRNPQRLQASSIFFHYLSPEAKSKWRKSEGKVIKKKGKVGRRQTMDSFVSLSSPPAFLLLFWQAVKNLLSATFCDVFGIGCWWGQPVADGADCGGGRGAGHEEIDPRHPILSAHDPVRRVKNPKQGWHHSHSMRLPCQSSCHFLLFI